VLPLLLALQIWDPSSLARLDPPLRQALAQLEGTPGYPRAVAEYAAYLVSQSRRAEADPWLRQAIRLRTDAADLEALAALGPPDALDLLAQAVRLREKQGPPPALARTLRKLGAAHEARRDTAAAEDAYRRALPLATGADLGLVANDLGLILEGRDDAKGAEALYRRALAAFERAHGPQHPEVGTALNNLAGALGLQGRIGEAEPLLRRALAVFESTLGPNHDRTSAALSNLADLLDARGRPAEANHLRKRAADARAARAQ
jgi:tetratricopeptide (TPR) repeat protein